MKNKPKCLFCSAYLEASSITVNKGLSSYYTLGNSKPMIAPNCDEIILQVLCPKCGAVGEALGDKVSFTGTMQHLIVTIDNVAIGTLTTGNGMAKAWHPKIQPFNPSKRNSL